MTDPTTRPSPITHAVDARGELLAVELGELPFAASRVFVVRGAPGGSRRGDHAIPCAQLMVLISGRVSVRIGPDADSLASPVELTEPGDAVELPAGQYVTYDLADAGSAVLVLADAPYRGTR